MGWNHEKIEVENLVTHSLLRIKKGVMRWLTYFTVYPSIPTFTNNKGIRKNCHYFLWLSAVRYRADWDVSDLSMAYRKWTRKTEKCEDFSIKLVLFCKQKKTSAVISYISQSIYVIFFAEKLSLRYLSNTCNDKNKILSGFGPVNVKNGFRIRIKRRALIGNGFGARLRRRAASLSRNYGSGTQLRLQME